MFNKLRFFAFLLTETKSRKKTEELGQYTAILTSITHAYFDVTDDFWTKNQA